MPALTHHIVSKHSSSMKRGAHAVKEPINCVYSFFNTYQSICFYCRNLFFIQKIAVPVFHFVSTVNKKSPFSTIPASAVPCTARAMCWCTAVVLAAHCLISFSGHGGLTLTMLPSAFLLVFSALCLLRFFIVEDVLSGLQAPSEPRTSAQKGVLSDHLDSPPVEVLLASSQALVKSARQIFSTPACTRVLGSFLRDPHSVCVRCRDLCNPGKRCSVCANWSPEKVLAAYRYQCSLRCRRDAKAKQRHRRCYLPLVTPPILAQCHQCLRHLAVC